MPTPRAHGGAPLIHFPMIVPGTKGLTTEASSTLLGPEWATVLQNTVLDSSNRISARKGYLNATTTSFSSATRLVSGIEYRKADGTTQLVATSATKVAASTNNGDTWTDVTGTASFTDGNWHLVNFHDYVLGFQSGKKILVYNGTTSSHVADANCPQGGVGTAAFGRAWGFASDGTTLRYSVLLDHTDFTGAGSGSFNLANVWPDTDSGMAVAAYNNTLVIFGKRNILILSDGSGSTIGLNPTNARIIDTIPGVGCLSQESVQLINGDLWFLSNSRQILSLQRVLLEQKSGKLSHLSLHVASSLRDALDNGTFSITRLRSTFSPKDRFYLLSLPTESSSGAHDEIGRVYAFDTNVLLEDGAARCTGIWTQLVPTVFFQRATGSFAMCIETVAGKIGTYSGYADAGSSYRVIYESGWMNITDSTEYLTILKRMNSFFLYEGSPSVVVKWAFDYSSLWTSSVVNMTAGGTVYEWGLAEWGLSEWGSGASVGTRKVAGSKTGQFIKVGVEASISSGSFTIQQLDLIAKVGRIAG